MVPKKFAAQSLQFPGFETKAASERNVKPSLLKGLFIIPPIIPSSWPFQTLKSISETKKSIDIGNVFRLI